MKNIRRLFFPFWWLYVRIVKTIQFAIFLVAFGIALYVGGWLMLFGGLADAINLFKGYDPVEAADVAIVIAQIIFAIPVGYLIVAATSGVIEEAGTPEDDDFFETGEKGAKNKKQELGYDEE